MDVVLKVCGGGLGFGVLCEYGEVVCVREEVSVWVGWEGDVMHEEVEKCGGEHGALRDAIGEVFCFG